MNRYALAHHEVSMALAGPGTVTAEHHRLATVIVDRLIAVGVIQSTVPGDLVPGGLTQ